MCRRWPHEAKANGTKKVFISFHSPVVCRPGIGAILDARIGHK